MPAVKKRALNKPGVPPRAARTADNGSAKKGGRALRLLPVAIAAAVLVLGIKLGGLWTGVTSLAQAQQAEEAPQAQKPGAMKASQGAGGAMEGGLAGTGDAQAASRAPDMLPDDPALFSQAEIDLLQKLAERRKQLDKWGEQLEMREGLLKAAEQRIERKVGELRTIQGKIKKMLRQYDKEQEEKLASLVKIYETMKPKDAARIFMQLDMPVLLDVIERMKERRVAPIIAELDPVKARDVTAELAKRRKIGEEAKQALPASGQGPLPATGDAAAPGNG